MDLYLLLANFASILFKALYVSIIIRALLSWLSLSPNNPLLTILYDITEPILAPLRRVVPRIGMIDITPVVAILLLQAIDGLLQSALR